MTARGLEPDSHIGDMLYIDDSDDYIYTINIIYVDYRL